MADPIETRAPGKCAAKSTQRRAASRSARRLPALGEAAVRAEGEGHQRQARVVEAAREVRRAARVGADHRVGDLDPGIAAVGDRPDQVVGPSGPGRAQHLPGVRLATELQRGNVHRRVLLCLRRCGAGVLRACVNEKYYARKFCICRKANFVNNGFGEGCLPMGAVSQVRHRAVAVGGGRYDPRPEPTKGTLKCPDLTKVSCVGRRGRPLSAVCPDERSLIQRPGRPASR